MTALTFMRDKAASTRQYQIHSTAHDSNIAIARPVNGGWQTSALSPVYPNLGALLKDLTDRLHIAEWQVDLQQVICDDRAEVPQ